MSENKKDATSVDSTSKKIATFKAEQLAPVNEQLAKQKSRAAALLTAIKAKRAAFIEEEEKKRLAEEETA